jgi:sulfur-oxidizing protein SoxY
METGLRPDGQADDDIEQQLVESLTVTLNDAPVLTARFFTGTSANPYLQFQLTPEEEGELKLVWQDQKGEQMETSQPVRF